MRKRAHRAWACACVLSLLWAPASAQQVARSAASLPAVNAPAALPVVPALTPGLLPLWAPALPDLPAVAPAVLSFLPGAPAPVAVEARAAALQGVLGALESQAAALSALPEDAGSRGAALDAFWDSGPIPRAEAGAMPSTDSSPDVPGRTVPTFQPAPMRRTPGMNGFASLGLGSLSVKALPVLKAAGVLGLTWLATKVAARAVKIVSKRAGWDPRVEDLARRVSGAAIWITGGAAALNAAGIEIASGVAALGVGASLPLSLAAREVLSPSVHGLRLLLSHPFEKSEALLIDGEPHAFQDMTLTDIVFTDEDGVESPYDYKRLSGKPITLFKEYDAVKGWIRLRRPSLSVPRLEGRKLLGLVPRWAEVRSFAPSVVTAAAMFTASALFHAVLAASVPYFYAAAILAGTWAVSKLLSRALQRLAHKHDWDPYAVLALRLILNVPIWAAGLGWTLHALGVTWGYVLGGLGITTLVVTVSATEVLTDIFKKWRYILAGRFYSGRHVKIGNHEGVVHDIITRGVVLRQRARFSDGRTQTVHTTVPFSYLEASEQKLYIDDRTQDPPEPYLKPIAEK